MSNSGGGSSTHRVNRLNSEDIASDYILSDNNNTMGTFLD